MYQLYYSPGKANLAPHMLLEEIGAPFQLVAVDTENNAHRGATYLRLNPNGRLPTLVDGELVLYETAAICLHLADRHPEARLVPTLGSDERAHFYKWLMYLTNTLQAELITYFYPDRLTDDAGAAAQVMRHAEARVGTMLDLVEETLAQHSAARRGPFLLGDAFSAVDPYLLMLCRWTRNMHHPARARHRLGRYLETLLARPAVMRALTAEGIAAPLV